MQHGSGGSGGGFGRISGERGEGKSNWGTTGKLTNEKVNSHFRAAFEKVSHPSQTPEPTRLGVFSSAQWTKQESGGGLHAATGRVMGPSQGPNNTGNRSARDF